MAAWLIAAAPIQDAPLRYTARQLNCTRWNESSHSEVETATDRGSSRATAGREGRWSFRARDTAGGVALEGWYDSLAVWRRADSIEVAPDTDGLIGGRFRGRLGPRGVYAAAARPFVPDEVAEVAELSGALDDLFPPLPPVLLTPGRSWRGPGIDISRLADSTSDGRALHRFSLQARHERRETTPRGDTLPVPIHQTISEEGEITWDPAAGLVRRTREIVVETSISAEGRIRQPVRSRVVQRVELRRVEGTGCGKVKSEE
jgi:hypothetical protein